MVKKYFDIVKNYLTKHFEIANAFYNEYRKIIFFLIIVAICFEAVEKLQHLRNFYFNQESFNLSEVPEGTVVWIYPKDKSQNALQPDSLKLKSLSDDIIIPLNYNVDVWVVAIHTQRDELIKIEVPDYAISYFKIGSYVGRSNK